MKYEYAALITEVYDGDTVTADIDLGLEVWKRGEKLRLHRINAPEVRGEQRAEGLIARDWLRKRLLDQEVTLITIKDTKGKYGRYLAEIKHEGENISDLLVEKKLAVYKEY